MIVADLNLGGRFYCDIPDDLASKIIDEIRSAEKLDRDELERKCQELKQKIVFKRGKRLEQSISNSRCAFKTMDF